MEAEAEEETGRAGPGDGEQDRERCLDDHGAHRARATGAVGPKSPSAIGVAQLVAGSRNVAFSFASAANAYTTTSATRRNGAITANVSPGAGSRRSRRADETTDASTVPATIRISRRWVPTTGMSRATATTSTPSIATRAPTERGRHSTTTAAVTTRACSEATSKPPHHSWSRISAAASVAVNAPNNQSRSRTSSEGTTDSRTAS